MSVLLKKYHYAGIIKVGGWSADGSEDEDSDSGDPYTVKKVQKYKIIISGPEKE